MLCFCILKTKIPVLINCTSTFGAQDNKIDKLEDILYYFYYVGTVMRGKLIIIFNNGAALNNKLLRVLDDNLVATSASHLIVH